MTPVFNVSGTAASKDLNLFHKHNDSSTLVSWPSVKEDDGQTEEKEVERKDKVKRREEMRPARHQPWAELAEALHLSPQGPSALEC